ncbi:MAG: hypothetical protein ACRCXZ_03410 [Patescibacteria group bacterium]
MLKNLRAVFAVPALILALGYVSNHTGLSQKIQADEIASHPSRVATQIAVLEGVQTATANTIGYGSEYNQLEHLIAVLQVEKTNTNPEVYHPAVIAGQAAAYVEMSPIVFQGAYNLIAKGETNLGNIFCVALAFNALVCDAILLVSIGALTSIILEMKLKTKSV